MRAPLILIPLCVACGGERSDGASPDPSGPATPADEAASVAPEPAPDPPSTAPTTTPGFIEATVNGEPKRFEHLPANHNTAAANGTFMEALARPDGEESFRLTLVRVDVRRLELPAEIRHDVRAMQLASLVYRDAEGTNYTLPFREPLRCQSLEDLRLRCTFSGTAFGDGGPVEITEGRLDVQLTTNDARDAIIEATGTAAP